MDAAEYVRSSITSHHAATDPDAPAWPASARTPEHLTGPAVISWPVSITRQPNSGRRALVAEVEAWLIVPGGDPEAADTALAVLLPELVAALEADKALSWDTLQRGVLDDRFHGWRAAVRIAYTTT